MFRALVASALFLAWAAQAVVAEDAAVDPKTVISERGKLLASEDLSKPIEGSKVGSLTALKSGWRFRPGKWEFVDGVLQGTQLKEQNHSGVAAFALPFKDAIIQVDCQMHGGRQITLRVNDTNEHICRTTITKAGFSAQRDDHDHDGPDKAVPFGEVKLPIAADEWKTVLLEIRGDEMAASIDGKSIRGSNPLIGKPKANIGLVVNGTSPRFRNLRIWEALPKSGP